MRHLIGCSVLAVLLPAAAAAQTGTITGTVTRADTAAPLSSVQVFVTNGAGYFSAYTNGAGEFSIANLTPGSYKAFTSVGGLFINEIFDNVACVGSCFEEVSSVGTPVAVASGGTSAGVNFALATSGRISGTVVDANGGAPLSGVFVVIAAADGQSVASGETDGMGQYTVTYGMVNGTYYAFTSSGIGYLNEIYPNVVCPSFCDNRDAVATGTPIPVTTATPVTGINFSLARGATIAGRVTAESGGLGLEDVRVEVYDEQGQSVGSVSTLANGDYVTPALVGGVYYLSTSNEAGFINEIYPDLACPGRCSTITAGEAITVATGQALAGKNFALAGGGRIAGTVTAAPGGAPLTSVGLQVYTSTGIPATEGFTDANGQYVTLAGLPSGTYYLVATDFDGQYVGEIYDNIPCVGCDAPDVVATGTPIVVTAGATVSGRNFQLTRGGSITGRVVSAASGAGVGGVQVRARGDGEAFGSANTAADGSYTIEGLPGGQYVMWTLYTEEQGFVSEIYDDIPCVGFCDDTTVRFIGTRVAVVAATTTPNINFALTPGATTTGTVTDAVTQAPIEGVTVYAATVAGGALVTGGGVQTDAAGAFTLTGLAPGVYVAYTSNTLGYIDEMLGGLPCMGGCGALAVIGTPFVATAGGSTGGLTFALERGGRISGTVTDAGTAQPIGNASIAVYDGTGRAVAFTTSAVNGSYTTETGLVPGTYFVTGARFPYQARPFGGVCRGICDGIQAVAAGTPVAVAGAATTSGIHLALERGGVVSGTVTEQGTGIVLASTNLRFYDAQGRFAVAAFTDSEGTYSLEGGLPTGSYFAVTDSERHVDEIYDNVACVGDCSGSQAPQGTPIPVAAGVTTSGRNFALAAASGLPGPPSRVVFLPTPSGLVIQWNEPTLGGVPTSYAIDIGLVPGATALTLAATTTEYQVTGAPPGRYYVRVRGLNAAGSGPPSLEEVLLIGGGALGPAVPRFATAWLLGSRLLMHWERNQYGGNVTHYLVEAGTAAGLANIATIPVSVPAFTYDGVPPGTFFLRVRAVNAAGVSGPSNEVMVVAGGAGAPPGTPYGLGAAVTGSTVALTWSTPAGPTTGYVLEAGSAPGLANAAVVTLGPQTAVAFDGVPPGLYYVRVRALNAVGTGLASEEVTVVVQ